MFCCRENSTDIQREGHEDDIISMVRVSLVDDEANVRSAAARAFDTLQEHMGGKAIDQTIPTLLEALRQPGQSSGTALQALREVMAVSLCARLHGACYLTPLEGPGFHSLPCLDTHLNFDTYDYLQCSSIGISCHRC
jgi:hypothetical protein